MTELNRRQFLQVAGLGAALNAIGCATMDSQASIQSPANASAPTADQISVPEDKIEKLTGGRIVHTGPDAPRSRMEIAFDRMDGLLGKGGTDEITAITRDLSAKAGVKAPDYLIMSRNDSGDMNNAFARQLGDRNFIVVTPEFMENVASMPADKKHDYIEGSVAHEIAHLKNGTAPQLLNELHPGNRAFKENEVEKSILRAEISSGMNVPFAPDVREEIRQDAYENIARQRAILADELGRMQPDILPVSDRTRWVDDQNRSIRAELSADADAARLTGKPAILDEALRYMEGKDGGSERVQQELRKQGVASHPTIEERSAQLKEIGNEMRREQPAPLQTPARPPVNPQPQIGR